MKIAEMRLKTASELAKLAAKDRRKISNLYTDLYSKEVKNVKEIKSLKRELARLLTVIKEKENS